MSNKYAERLGRMLIVASLVVGAFTSRAKSQTVDAPPIETEAQRLEAIRNLISQEKSRRLVGDADGKPQSTAAVCERMLDDLLSRKGFKAIEPVAVLDFEYPLSSVVLSQAQEQKNARIAAERLGPSLTKSLQRCAADGRGDALKFDGFFSSTGAPPFRAYVLPKNVNPFPGSKLVYWSEYEEKTGLGRKGYTWVNLDICERTGGTPSLTDSLRLKKDPQGQRSSLTLYQEKVVSWDIAKGFLFSAHVVLPNPKRGMDFQAICSWATYPETPATK